MVMIRLGAFHLKAPRHLRKSLIRLHSVATDHALNNSFFFNRFSGTIQILLSDKYRRQIKEECNAFSPRIVKETDDTRDLITWHTSCFAALGLFLAESDRYHLYTRNPQSTL